jgi:phosphopantothenoylcysteine decarboxylase/phosphopantothenate--cysteine ligase
MGIEVADNALQVFWPGGSQSLPRAAKQELARDLVASIAQRYRASRA